MSSSQTLYNGIELPQPWPPRWDRLSLDPPSPPYLVSPPKVIPIDVGRQLFVDDFLIEQTTLSRTMHTAEYHASNPVLEPDKPWEDEGVFIPVSSGRPMVGPFACPFSDGVWYDPDDKLFKMWYMAGRLFATCYASSQDGIHWEKPELDVVPGTNIVHPGNRDTSVVWLDLNATDPQRRYVLYRFEKKPRRGFALHYSADGIHWSDEILRAGECLDRATVFYNPFRGVWVHSLKAIGPVSGYDESIPKSTQGYGDAERIVRYWEQEDLVDSPMWTRSDEPYLWVHTDRRDPVYPGTDCGQPKIYDLDAVAYESLIIGAFAILETYYPGVEEDRPKRNQIQMGFSRDGFHWDRPLRKPLAPVSDTRGDWNWGNMQPAGGICLVVGDELHFYFSGRAGCGRTYPEPITGPDAISARDCDASTGIAVLRRDGFASMDGGAGGGTLTTRPVLFSGKYLFVNVDCSDGELQVEVLDLDGKVIEPFTREGCEHVSVDKTLQSVSWSGIDDLSSLAGQPVRFRFSLTQGRLYSFWVSPQTSGASHGYVAAGGPGFTGHTDTVGMAAGR